MRLQIFIIPALLLCLTGCDFSAFRGNPGAGGIVDRIEGAAEIGSPDDDGMPSGERIAWGIAALVAGIGLGPVGKVGVAQMRRWRERAAAKPSTESAE